MDIVIRPARPEDAAATCEVLCRSIRESCVQDHRNDEALLAAWLGNKTPQTVAGWFASASNYTVVAERDGRIVGASLLNQAGKLALCYVVPEEQGQGVGRAMLEEVEAQARRWGVGTIRLQSTATASGFYAHLGYTCEGKDRACFGLECDFFWKRLDAPAPGDEKKRYCPCNA